MSTNRRQFIQAGLVGGAGIAAGGLPASAKADHHVSGHGESLDILILGGTGYIGPHMVREALRRGHSVSLFNRGRTNNELFPDLTLFKGDRDGGLDALKGQKFDAVIDNSGYVPRHVHDSATLLKDNISHYVFVSTISVYDSFAVANNEDSPLGKMDDETVEEVTGETYGPLKVLCEKRAAEVMGPDDITILRPTYICGPGDKTDRFSWWPIRTAMGGEMLWPGKPADPIQIIDVRDFAMFTLDSIEQKIAGTFNTVTPKAGYTIGELHDDCMAITAADTQSVWVDAKFLADQEMTDRGNIPVWADPNGEAGKVAWVDGTRATAAGMTTRPIRETARDTLSWWKVQPEERTAEPRAGLKPEGEAELIAAFKASGS